MLNQYVASGFLTPAVAKSLAKYGQDKKEEAVQAAVLAVLQGLDPLAAARRAVEPEFSCDKLKEINYFYSTQLSAEEGRLADTTVIANGLGVGLRRAQQILKATLASIQDDRQRQLFGGVL